MRLNLRKHTIHLSAPIICFVLFLFLTPPALAQVQRVTCRVEADHGLLKAGVAQEVVLKVSLDAPPAPVSATRPRVNLALVLDQSGSMQGTKIKMAKEAALEALSRLGATDRFSLVVYDTQVTT
ncbi:MAG: VWA domain-containing protein, partial [Desulfobacterales bacterium]|nr:VWA domain-containing protein [Desulfobacterales bacterium]